MTEKKVSPIALEDAVQEHVKTIVMRCGGNLLAASKLLRISRSTLYRILQRGPYEHLARQGRTNK